MLMKRFMTMILFGIGMELGTCLTKEGIEIAKDPYKRAVVKQKITRIKETIFKKEEEPV